MKTLITREAMVPVSYCDKQWRLFRTWFLFKHPICHDCNMPANEVHHIVKVRDDRERKHDPENCMALCHVCHSKRTARGE